MEKKLTKIEYYEDIIRLLTQSNLIDSSLVPKETLYNNRIEYLGGLARFVKPKYDIIENMTNSDVEKCNLKNEINKNDILKFLNNELELDVQKIFYENLSTDKEYQTILRRLLDALQTDKPYTISEIIRENPYDFEEVSHQRINALLMKLTNKKFVEEIKTDKKTQYKKSKKLDYVFKTIRDNYLYLSNDIEQFIILKQRETTRQDEKVIENEVKNNKQNLIEYIQGIINIETDIISLKKRYNSLQTNLVNNIVENFEEYFEIETSITNSKNELLNNIKNIEKKIQEKPQLTFTIKVEKPKKPSKPLFNVVEPKLPIYLKANIFNKKKIEIENEKLKLNYEEELKKYEEELKSYNEKIEKYEKDIIKYNEEVLICEEKEHNLNKEKYEEELKEYNAEVEKLSLKLQQEKEKLEHLNKNYVQEKEKEFSKNSKYNELQAIIYEMDYITSIIEKNIELEHTLYSKGIIYIKYREYVPLTRFCDYLLSGRCSELEGPNGAYNIYEQEIRTDNIISKLDKIELSLEEIKNNQIQIYNELIKINHSLDLINGQLLVSNILQVVQIAQLDKVIQNTNQIAYNTQVTAYYAEKVANYQKSLLLLNLFNK